MARTTGRRAARRAIFRTAIAIDVQSARAYDSVRIKLRGLGLGLRFFMVSRLIDLLVLLISKSVREPTRAVKRA